jgi:predicted nucleic acid-binding protein
MSTLVDSNVVIDLCKKDSAFFVWSLRSIMSAANEGPLLINQIVYAETAGEFKLQRDFELAFKDIGLEFEDLPWSCAFMAGQAHKSYRQAGGPRSRTLPDFLIGAHAVSKGHRLLTRDARRYRNYFPTLELIAPDTHP